MRNGREWRLDGRARCDFGQVLEALTQPFVWMPTNPAQYSRLALRYGSDVTDADWRILSPFLLAARRCGCRRKWKVREILNAIFYILRGGIAWSLLAEYFLPWPTAYRRFVRFRDDGTWEQINHHLVMLDCERSGREASPTAAVTDSQSVKTTEAGGIRCSDAGKKVNGRERHAMVDSDGCALKLQAHSAGIPDRDGAGPLLRASRPSYPFVALGYADGG
jgi:transposase